MRDTFSGKDRHVAFRVVELAKQPIGCLSITTGYNLYGLQKHVLVVVIPTAFTIGSDPKAFSEIAQTNPNLNRNSMNLSQGVGAPGQPNHHTNP